MSLVVERSGLGYALLIADLATELRTGATVRSRGEIHAELTISCGLPAIASQTGHLFRGRFNFSAISTRTALAKHLNARTQGAGIDWAELLETLCVGILSAESEGAPFEDVGARPSRMSLGYLVDPLLPYGKPTILFGDGGVGKSFFAIAMAVSLVSGRTVIEGFTPRGQMAATYLDWETDADDIDERVKAVCAGIGIAPVSIRYRPASRPLADSIEAVARQMAEEPGLLIVDSVGLAQGMSSEGSDAADSALRFFAALRAVGSTSLSIDHVAKTGAGQPGGAGKPYGSTYKTNIARSTWELRQARTPDQDGTVHLGLFHRKANTMAKHRPIGLAMTFGPGVVRWSREEVRPENLGGQTNVEMVADALRAHPLTTREIAKETDLTEAVIRAVFSRYRDRFVKTRTGNWALLETERAEPA